MKTTITFFLTTLLLTVTKFAVSQSVTFERYYDFGNDDVEQAYCVQQTTDGGYIMTGRKAGLGTTKLLVLKVDSIGAYQWHKTYGNNLTYNYGQSIKQTFDLGYVIVGGMMETNGQNYVCLLKLNNQGDTLWLKKFTYTNQNAVWGVTVLQNTDGGYSLLSNVVDSTDVNWTTFLTKTDENGNELWTKKYKKDQGTSPGSFIATQESGFIIAGYTNPSINNNDIYLIKTDSIGDTLWTKTITHPNGYTYLLSRSNCINETADGGYFITATVVDSLTTFTRILIIKTDANGDTLWTKKISDIDNLWGSAGGFQSFDGGYFIGGEIVYITPDLFTNINFFVVKVSDTGDVIWKKNFGGATNEYCNYIIPASNSGFVICGMETSWGDGGGVYLIKSDSIGNAQSYINGIYTNYNYKGASIRLFPNPFSDMANVTIDAAQNSEGIFYIYDAIGNCVKSIPVTSPTFELNKDNLLTGFYTGVFKPKNISNPIRIKFIIH